MRKLILAILLIPSAGYCDYNELINALAVQSATETRYLNELIISEQLGYDRQNNIAARALMRDIQPRRRVNENTYIFPSHPTPRSLFGEGTTRTDQGYRPQLRRNVWDN